jgi:hypothetical protein
MNKENKCVMRSEVVFACLATVAQRECEYYKPGDDGEGCMYRSTRECHNLAARIDTSKVYAKIGATEI